MRKCLIGISLILAFQAPARAGVFTDDLSRCLVSKASGADREAFMAWMLSVISSSPTLGKFTVLDRAKRDALAKSAGQVVQRLLVSECRSEAVAALKNEGSSIENAFGALGEAAVQQMFQSKEAKKELESLQSGFDEKALEELGREAGVNSN